MLEKRENMVRFQIEPRGIENPAVLDAMRKVERHRLVPDHLAHCAYEDFPLPIGKRQTISQPYIVALMTELLLPQPDHKILEIGTGSGYQAAVLAEIVSEVFTIEIVPELAVAAQEKLSVLGYTNIHCRSADGGVGWAEEAPFDGIIVTAAARVIPTPLIAQLKVGGRMVIPCGDADAVQTLAVVVKTIDGTEFIPNISVRFVPMTGQSQRL
jgi:protein-L-isoaspartate(D-aspartate) O-methyltransferase